MKQLYWDEEIAKKSQEQAYKHAFVHSSPTFRQTNCFPNIGENLYFGTFPQQMEPQINWEKEINMWFTEIENFVNDSGLSVTSFRISATAGPTCHFTQVI